MKLKIWGGGGGGGRGQVKEVLCSFLDCYTDIRVKTETDDSAMSKPLYGVYHL